MYDLSHELDRLITLDAAGARQYVVENVTLSVDNSEKLVTLKPSTTLKRLASGESPSHEHTGIAARLVYQMDGGPQALLNRLPSLAEPESWAMPDRLVQIILAYFQPWRNWRFDPSSETTAIALETGQWSFRLRGVDSEIEMKNFVAEYVSVLIADGYDSILKWLLSTGLILMPDLTNPDVDPDEVARIILNNCRKVFNKYIRTYPTKALMDRLMAHPLMRYDRTTVNTLSGFAAFGNGVVPTKDIQRKEWDEFGHKEVSHPAGILVKADTEFMLPSASGIEWPTNHQWNKLMEKRALILNGMGDIDWEDWLDEALQLSEYILEFNAPTYKEFLVHSFPSGQSEPPLERDAFLRAFGEIVFGSGLKLLIAMIGKPNAGKDTAIKWLKHLLGSQQIGNLSQNALTANLDEQRAFAPLQNARVAVVSGEVGEGRSNAFMADKIKSVTSGGGFLTVAEKYAKPTTIFFDGALIIQGNAAPTIIGADEALNNRLIPIPFRFPFPLAANTEHYDRRYSAEAPAFLQVLFVHFLHCKFMGGGKKGINPPEAWNEFGGEITTSADPLTIIDKCITQPDSTKEIAIPASTFYKALNILAHEHLGLRNPLSSVRWAERLKRAGVEFSKLTNEYRTKSSAHGGAWMFHFTLNADYANGAFSQQDWDNALTIAAVARA